MCERFCDRLKQALAAEGMTQTDFSRKTGFDMPYISHLLSAQRLPSFGNLAAILYYLQNTDARWLITGQVPAQSNDCGNCHRCLEGKLVDGPIPIPVTATRMILCPACSNKRCPKATDHHQACTDSNEPGQPGSVYTAATALGEPAVPMTPSEAVILKARAEGRAEACDILLDAGPEALDDVTVTYSIGDTGDYGSGFDQEKLKKLLGVSDAEWSLIDNLCAAYWKQEAHIFELNDKLAAAPAHGEPAKWDGEGLPPVGADVLFNTASDGDQIGTVTGYHVWDDLDGNPAVHRVFIDLVYKGTTIKNCRLLKNVRPLDATPARRDGV